MKKLLLRDKQSFHTWQEEVSKKLDSNGQILVSSVKSPTHYPVIIIWITYEEINGNSGMGIDIADRFEYIYVYPDSFPHKEVKTGMYIYQIARTSEAFETLMES